ncbi:MAG: serine hydrolase [Ekhidna sp.]|nr:serine hydrolase [Ekhidna sp.]
MNFKNSTLMLCILLFIFQCQGQADPPSNKTDKDFKEKMDAFSEMVIDSLNINFGFGMAVVKGEYTVYEGYYGLADFENGIPVTPETNFYIASSTKSFTALAMLMLDHKGIIDLDRSLASFFPEGEFDSELNAEKVNLRDLLYHTSGIENNNITFSLAYTGIYTQESLAKNLLDYTQPDSRSSYGEFKYSNLGYNVIEIILERELGKTWKQVVKEEVLDPLGMNKTSGNISDVDKYDWPSAVPYSEINPEGDLERIPLRKKDRIMHAAGGLISTPRDMTKFLKAELNEGVFDGKQVFPKEVIALSQKAQADQKKNFLGLNRFAYGYGWNIATTALGDTLIHHYGGFPGTTTQVSFMPEHNVGLSIYGNEGLKGLISTFLLTSYAFDYYAGREDLDTYYKEQLSEYKSMILDQYKKMDEQLAKRAERTWQLDLEFEEYTGIFSSPSVGDMEVSLNDNSEFIVSLGYLKSGPATPFTSANSIRAEMIPGSGSVIQFKVEDGSVVSLNSNGLTFKKVK